MAGLTNNGLVIKRLPEITTSLQDAARQIFADLVPPGDEVDVGPTTTIGRLIGLITPSHADLWEALQQVHDSFNPNAASGYALDNIVTLSGITRYGVEPTRASCLFEGNNNVLIGLNVKVSSSISRRIFSLANTVSLNQYQSSGIGISVNNVQNNTVYRVSYSTDEVNFTNVSITSDGTATAAEILAALKTAFDTTTGGAFTTYYKDGNLFITRSDPFQTVTFDLTTNLRIQKCQKLGVVLCDEIGPLPQPAGTIDTIAVPVLGWDNVSNPLPAVEGRFEESDEELRERFRNSKFFQAANVLEAMVDALRNTEGVRDVTIYENDTDTTDTLGVPAHSFMPIVLGGLPTSIGQAIWQNKPTGIRSVGNTTVVVSDSQGIGHSISFRRPDELTTYIKLNISDIGGMPGDVVARIKESLIKYFEESYTIGDEVVYSRLYGPINSVQGFQVNTLYIGTSPNPSGMSNIPVLFNQVATLNADNIEITIS